MQSPIAKDSDASVSVAVPPSPPASPTPVMGDASPSPLPPSSPSHATLPLPPPRPPRPPPPERATPRTAVLCPKFINLNDPTNRWRAVRTIEPASAPDSPLPPPPPEVHGHPGNASPGPGDAVTTLGAGEREDERAAGAQIPATPRDAQEDGSSVIADIGKGQSPTAEVALAAAQNEIEVFNAPASASEENALGGIEGQPAAIGQELAVVADELSRATPPAPLAEAEEGPSLSAEIEKEQPGPSVTGDAIIVDEGQQQGTSPQTEAYHRPKTSIVEIKGDDRKAAILPPARVPPFAPLSPLVLPDLTQSSAPDVQDEEALPRGRGGSSSPLRPPVLWSASPGPTERARSASLEPIMTPLRPLDLTESPTGTQGHPRAAESDSPLLTRRYIPWNSTPQASALDALGPQSLPQSGSRDTSKVPEAQNVTLSPQLPDDQHDVVELPSPTQRSPPERLLQSHSSQALPPSTSGGLAGRTVIEDSLGEDSELNDDDNDDHGSDNDGDGDEDVPIGPRKRKALTQCPTKEERCEIIEIPDSPPEGAPPIDVVPTGRRLYRKRERLTNSPPPASTTAISPSPSTQSRLSSDIPFPPRKRRRTTVTTAAAVTASSSSPHPSPHRHRRRLRVTRQSIASLGDDVDRVFSVIPQDKIRADFANYSVALIQQLESTRLFFELMLIIRRLSHESASEQSDLDLAGESGVRLSDALDNLAGLWCACKLGRDMPIYEVSADEVRELMGKESEFENWCGRIAIKLSPYTTMNKKVAKVEVLSPQPLGGEMGVANEQ